MNKKMSYNDKTLFITNDLTESNHHKPNNFLVMKLEGLDILVLSILKNRFILKPILSEIYVSNKDQLKKLAYFLKKELSSKDTTTQKFYLSCDCETEIFEFVKFYDNKSKSTITFIEFFENGSRRYIFSKPPFEFIMNQDQALKLSKCFIDFLKGSIE